MFHQTAFLNNFLVWNKLFSKLLTIYCLCFIPKCAFSSSEQVIWSVLRLPLLYANLPFTSAHNKVSNCNSWVVYIIFKAILPYFLPLAIYYQFKSFSQYARTFIILCKFYLLKIILIKISISIIYLNSPSKLWIYL